MCQKQKCKQIRNAQIKDYSQNLGYEERILIGTWKLKQDREDLDQ